MLGVIFALFLSSPAAHADAQIWAVRAECQCLLTSSEGRTFESPVYDPSPFGMAHSAPWIVSQSPIRGDFDRLNCEPNEDGVLALTCQAALEAQLAAETECKEKHGAELNADSCDISVVPFQASNRNLMRLFKSLFQ